MSKPKSIAPLTVNPNEPALGSRHITNTATVALSELREKDKEQHPLCERHKENRNLCGRPESDYRVRRQKVNWPSVLWGWMPFIPKTLLLIPLVVFMDRVQES